MKESLRVAIADDKPRMIEYFQVMLPPLGHQVVATAATGQALVEQVRRHKPDLVITDIRMPEMDGIEAAAEICREDPTPVILVSAHSDEEYIARSVYEYIFAYLIKPIKKTDLQPAIHIAMTRFEQFQSLRQESQDLRQALSDRKVIERAKGILMRKSKLDEDSAFRKLQRMARDRNQRLVEVAQMFIAVDETLTEVSETGG